MAERETKKHGATGIGLDLERDGEPSGVFKEGSDTATDAFWKPHSECTIGTGRKAKQKRKQETTEDKKSRRRWMELPAVSGKRKDLIMDPG